MWEGSVLTVTFSCDVKHYRAVHKRPDRRCFSKFLNAAAVLCPNILTKHLVTGELLALTAVKCRKWGFFISGPAYAGVDANTKRERKANEEAG